MLIDHSDAPLRWLVDDSTDFFGQVWQRTPKVMRPSPSLADQLALSGDTLMGTELLRVPFVEVVKDRRKVATEDYTHAVLAGPMALPGFVNESALLSLMRDGSTVVFNGLEQWHGPARRVAGLIGRALARYVEAGLFLTPPGEQGFVVHRDPQDLFVVQLAGSKRWTVYPGPDGPSWRVGPEPKPGTAVLEATLRTGEVLYIPRGAAHCAKATTEHSSHITFGVRGVTAETIEGFVIAALDSVLDPELRPRDADEESAQFTSVLRSLTEHLRTAIVADIDDDGLNPLPSTSAVGGPVAADAEHVGGMV